MLQLEVVCIDYILPLDWGTVVDHGHVQGAVSGSIIATTLLQVNKKADCGLVGGWCTFKWDERCRHNDRHVTYPRVS